MGSGSQYRLSYAGLAHPPGAQQLIAVAKRMTRWGLDVFVVGMLSAALLAAVLPFVGYRPLVVRSGSMTPALLTGDLIVTQLVRPASVRVGDIVTFSDQSRGNVLVTHRVVEMAREGSKYSFITKGDGNTAVEEWTIGDKGELGRFAFRVPKAGFLVWGISTPPARAGLAGLFLVLATVTALRRIWS